MGEQPNDLYIGLNCQHCSRPIMSKNDIEHISDTFHRGRVEEVKTLLTKLKCQECDRNVSDQVIWNYQEFLAKEHHDWVIKNREEVWPYDPKGKPHKFAVHKSGGYGVMMDEDEESDRNG